MPTLEFSSSLPVAASRVWSHASSFRGINEEIWPLHMSGPVDTVLDETTPVGRVVLRSVVTLARVVPFDVHSLVLAEVWPGRGFHEASYSLLQRRWVHVRTVESVDDRRCIVRDRLEFEPRVLSAITERIVRAVFARRHARLQAKFAS